MCEGLYEPMREWGFVALGTIIFILLNMLMKYIFQNDFGRLFRCIRTVLAACFLISVCIWIIKVVLTGDILEIDYTLGMVLFVLCFIVIDFLVYLTFRVKRKKPIHSRSYQHSLYTPRFKVDLLQNSFLGGRFWILTTLSIIGAPAFICTDIWYLISTYL